MRKLILFTSFCSVALLCLMFSNLSTLPKGEREAGDREREEILGTINWFTDLRSNQETGEFDPTFMYKAMDDAKAMAGVRNVNLVWESMGPDNVGGRTRAVLFEKNTPGLIFAGGVSGGLWKSVNNGDSWEKVPGDFSVLTVTCIAQASDGTIYFGTGEGFYDIGLNIPTGFSAPGFPGHGIWKSTDAGNTWTHLTATIPSSLNSTTVDWAYVSRIAISPNDPNRLYAATNKNVKISTDAGNSWVQATGTPITAACYDVKTGGDGYVYACAASKYYRSTAPDGNTFELKSGLGGFPNTTGRLEFAIAPTNPAYVYAVASKTNDNLEGVYKSTDGGLNWTLIGPGGSSTFEPLNGQGFYNIALGVLPTNPDVIYFGGALNLYKYTPELGWFIVADWLADFFYLPGYVHADMHGVVFNPANPNEMFIACDGGVFRSLNATDLYPIFGSVNRKYVTTQAYSVAARSDGRVIFGLQDNGTQYINFEGNTDASSVEIMGGDGMTVAIARSNEKAFFGEIYSGGLSRSSNEGSGMNSFFDFRIDGGTTPDGFPDNGADWIAPYALWEAPDSSHSFFAFGTGTGTGYLWITLGALDFASDPDWFRLPQTSGYVTCVAFAADGNSVYAGTSTGTIYRYSNLQQAYAEGKFAYSSISATAATWNAVDSGITVASTLIGSGRYLRSIATDPKNINNVIVTAARYNSTAYVWRSTNAAGPVMTFTDVTANLPKMPVWSSLIDWVNPNIVLIGTDLGVYARDFSSGNEWSEQNVGMDKVPVLSMTQVNYFGQTNHTYIATYGRGIFKTASLVGVKDVDVAVGDVSLYPNPAVNSTILKLNLAKGSDLEIRLYDLKGQLVYSQKHESVPAGKHSYTIPAHTLQSGTYIVSVNAGGSSSSIKMVIAK